MGVASVAVPITQTAAVRTPAMMTGAASGSSTRVSDCHGVMPTPRAAIFTPRSIPARAVMVFLRTGSIE